MHPYLDLLRDVLDHGVDRDDRTGTGTRAVFGRQLRFDLSRGFPAVTTKKLYLKGVIHELLWFLRGETNIATLRKHGVHIWDEWADEHGDLGPVYGKQWRAWGTRDGGAVDQIRNLAHQLRKNPDSRRMVVSAWNVGELEQMVLMPCHILFQAFSKPTKMLDDGKALRRSLSLQVYIRSNDLFLGAPFNIASYALFTMMLAQVTGHVAGDLVYTIGDAHIYRNHFTQVETQLTRKPYSLPTMEINPRVRDIDGFWCEDFELIDYRCHPAIKGAVAV